MRAPPSTDPAESFPSQCAGTCNTRVAECAQCALGVGNPRTPVLLANCQQYVTPALRDALLRFAWLALLVLPLAACGAETGKETKPAAPAKQDVKKPAAAESLVQLSKEDLDDGWISLFDSETLFGWKAHSKADWQVKDGAIVVTEGEPGLLCTTTPFADYALHVEFRADPKTNSGVFLRTAPVVGKDDVTTRCYELNIAPADNPFPTGSFVGRQKASADCQDEGWRSFEVAVQGDQAIVRYNGKTVLEYTDPKPIGRGLIGLQLNSGKVEFRNIKLKPLGQKSLFNGKDLSGWKEAGESKFSVTDDGSLHVAGGKGYLESEQSFGDFVLQLECITNAKNLNSGLFFRCIPSEPMNGYESQIHNGFKDGDRSKPVDGGTGGIFRRVNARRVVADDQQWFAKTIIAAGPHMAVWVNGYQVTDWTDERKPDKNPRNGLRTEPGTLQIQGHDPTTDISFRNLRAIELPAGD